MESVYSFLFCLAAAQLLHGAILPDKIDPNRRLSRATEEKDPRLFECYTAEQQKVQDECFMSEFMKLEGSYAQKLLSCVDANMGTKKDSSLKSFCEANVGKEFITKYTTCYFSKIGAGNIATDPLDSEAFKAATIKASLLDETQKSAALKDFDSCMAANYSLPYSFYSFRTDKFPEVFQNFIGKFKRQLIFGHWSPTPSILAIDCLDTVLLQNGCGTTSEEAIAVATKSLLLEEDEDENYLRCRDKDEHWIAEMCVAFAMHDLANRWIQNCTKGKVPITDDTGCLINRMKQFREATVQCYMQRIKATDDVSKFKQHMIGGSSLTDDNKKAAEATFDKCLAMDVTSPYKVFPFEIKKIPGPLLVQEITAKIDQVFSIGNLAPAMPMRIFDCGISALVMNGCDSSTPDENLKNVLKGLTWFDEEVDRLNI